MRHRYYRNPWEQSPHSYSIHLSANLPGNADATGAEDSVAALVDREGEFIARSIDYAVRVGTPGTSYVLDAVAKGGNGIYAGTTYEALTNYTAYATSELTGWSSHVAISSAVLDRPLQRAAAVITFGLLAAILAGLGLFVLAAREVVRRRKNEEHLLNLQRSQAVAQFTATIVHDFRNVISSLQSGLNLIKRKTRNDEIKSYVALIEDSVSKGTRLANQLLSLSHGKDTELETVDVSEMLNGLRYLLEQAAGDGVALSIDEMESHLAVVANRDQLELALLNLVVNARDALEGQGRITIEVSSVGERAEIVVCDNGPGVSAKLQRTLFQPFITDKPQGTGLGLAQVAGMARNAGGEVALENVSEGGARFVIRLNQARTVEQARGSDVPAE
ncbi:HAMP domain-containing histidine kinase [Silicimonas algicola]|nr:HAMP domain-containing histidine kinase [Silicimonas algicola]